MERDAYEAFKAAFVASMLKNKDNWNERYVVKGTKSYTRLELAAEVTGDTEEGVAMLIMMMNMSAELLKRDKSR